MALSIGTITALLELRDNFTKKLEAASRSVDQFAGKAKKMGDSMQSVGQKMSMSLTLPIAGAAAGATMAFLGFEKAMKKTQAAMADGNKTAAQTAAELDMLKAAAIEWGQKTSFSAAEAGDALAELAKAGFSATKAVDALPSVLQLAEASSIGLADAASITANTMSTFGLAAEDLGAANDVLTKAVLSATIDIVDLRETLKYVGPSAKAAGMSLGEVSAAAALLAGAGLKGSMAGTGLKNVLNSMANPSNTAAAAMKKLGIESFVFEGSVMKLPMLIDVLSEKMAGLGGSAERSAALVEMFGLKGGPLMEAALEQGSVALRKFEKDMEASAGTAKTASEIMMSGLGGALEEMRGGLETAAMGFGEILAPAIGGAAAVIQKLAGVMVTVLQPAFKAMPVWIQASTGALVLMVAAAGPVVYVMGTLTKNAGLLAAGFVWLTKTQVGAAAATRALSVSQGTALATSTVWAAGTTTLAGAMFTLGNTTTVLTARIWLLEAGQKAAAVASNILAVAKARLIAVMVAATLNVSTLAARLGILSGAQGAAALASRGLAVALAGVGTAGAALMVASVWIGLLAALAAATYGAAQGVRGLWAAMREGKTVEFLTQRDEDNFVRRALGMGSTAQQLATDYTGAAATMARVSGADAQKAMNDLGISLTTLQSKGEVVPGTLGRIVAEARALEAQGATLTPAIARLIAGMQAPAGPSTLGGMLAAARAELTKLGAESPQKMADLRAAIKSGVISVEDMAGASGISARAVEMLQQSMEKTGTAATTATDHVKDFADGAKDLGAKIDIATKNGASGELILKLYGSAAAASAEEAQAWGVKVSASVARVATAFTHAEKATAWLGQFTEKKSGMAAWVKTFEASVDASEKAAKDAEQKREQGTQQNADAMVRIQEEAFDHVAAMEADTLALREETVRRDMNLRRAALDANGANYKDALDEVARLETVALAQTRQTWMMAGSATRAQLAATALDAADRYEAIRNSGVGTAAAIQAAFDTMKDAQAAAAAATRTTWLQAFGAIAQGLAYLGSMAGDGKIGKGLQQAAGVASQLQAQIATYAEGNRAGVASDLFNKQATKGSRVASGINSGFAIAGGAMSIWNATGDAKSRGGAAMGGMMAGAQAGAAFGPYGMAIGAIAGLAVGLIRGKAAWAKAQTEIGRDFKGLQKISDDTAKAIQKQTKELFRGNRQAGNLFAIDKIIDEGGGLTDGNVKGLTAQLRDVFVMLETGAFTAAQATDVLGRSWGKFAEHAVASGKLASKEFLEIGALADKMGITIEGRAAHLQSALAGYGSGLARMMGPLRTVFADAKKVMDDAVSKGDALRFAAPGGNAEAKVKGDTSLLGAADKAALEMADAQQAQAKERMVGLQGEYERFASLTVAGIKQAQASGLGYVATFDAMGDALDTLIPLQQMYKDLGIETAAAGIEQIIAERALINAHRDKVDAAQAFNDTLVAGSFLGVLNAEAMRTFGEQGLASFEGLIAAGFSQRSALQMHIEGIKTAAERYVQLGIPMDENTQKLYDMAKAEGLFGKQAASTNDLLIDGLGALITVLGGELPASFVAAGKAAQDAAAVVDGSMGTAFDDMAAHAETGAAKVKAALDGIPAGKTIDIEFVGRGMPGERAAGGGDYTPEDDRGYAVGTIGRHGSWFHEFDKAGEWTKLHGTEAVLRPQDVEPFVRSFGSAKAPAAMSPAMTESGGRPAVEKQDAFIAALESMAVLPGGGDVKAREPLVRPSVDVADPAPRVRVGTAKGLASVGASAGGGDKPVQLVLRDGRVIADVVLEHEMYAAERAGLY